MTQYAQIKSPCVLTCKLDLERGLCLGCARSREEIAMWSHYTDARRDSIMAGLPDKLAALLADRDSDRPAQVCIARPGPVQ